MHIYFDINFSPYKNLGNKEQEEESKGNSWECRECHRVIVVTRFWVHCKLLIFAYLNNYYIYIGTKYKEDLDKSIPHCKRCLKNLDKDGKCYLCGDKVKYLI